MINKDSFNDLREKIRNFLGDGKESYSTIFEKCFFNTLDTTCDFREDGKVFVLTGDIPAMWLRDSAAQVLQYLEYAEDENVRHLIKGVLKQQFDFISMDPYANAFKKSEEQVGEWDNVVDSDRLPKIVWERKYELDSLCYPLFLASKYYEKTNDISCFDEYFIKAFDEIINTVRIEQKHSEKSSYFFYRVSSRIEDVGKSNPDGEKGLVWSGFRPSDDACKYPYHIPDNMFLVSVLYKMVPIFDCLKDGARRKICQDLIAELKPLIDRYGIVEDYEYGKVYVSETDCLGNYHVDDDANIPSCLSIPYLEYPFMDKEIYANTRKFILSKRNKYYYEGKILKGIGSPHTPENRVWPLAIAVQGLTSEDEKEIFECFKMLIDSTAGTELMHEGVDCNDVNIYSRSWFAWANSMFAYFVLKKIDTIKKFLA